MLHCLSAADGKPIWKLDTAERFGVIQNFFGVGSTPVVEGELLIVQIGGSPEESKRVPPGQLNLVEGNGSGIVAFDKKTGEVRYKITKELASYATPKLATIAGRRWCFVFARGGLVGFEPAMGKVDFEFPWRAGIIESVNASDPVVKHDQVFISQTYGPGGALLRVSPDNAQVVWSDAEKRRDKSMELHWNTAIELDGYLYGSSGRHTENAELRCVEWSSGKVMWSEPGLTRASLLYVDGHFVCLSEDGALRLIKVNSEKYEPVAEVVLRGVGAAQQDAFDFGPPRLLRYPAWSAPILAHGLLYVRGADRLVCLELISGSGPPQTSR
jgi:outer membrane protein assembly factor BamB